MNVDDVFTCTYQSGSTNFRRIVAIEGGVVCYSNGSDKNQFCTV